MKTNNKGFSLVELIVVIAIMAILAAVAIPTFATFIGKAQVASDVDYMNQVESAIELAYAQKGYAIETMTVYYATANNQNLPKSVVVKFANVENTVTITEADAATGSTAPAEEKDAAAVIDWKYSFNKTNYKTEKPDSWKTTWVFDVYSAG